MSLGFPVFERESIIFKINDDPNNEQYKDVQKVIQKLAEQLLYHWKSVPLILPPSITDDKQAFSNVYGHAISLKDLFVAPVFDELQQVARDGKGNSIKLSHKQLQSIRQMGQFDVQSMNFSGQSHTWKLTKFLQKGSKKAHETMMKDTALALKMIIIHSKNRFTSHFFSIACSYKMMKRGLWQFMDCLVGMSWMSLPNISEKLLDEYSRYLVAELNVPSDYKEEWKVFCNYIRDKCENGNNNPDDDEDHLPPITFRFITPKGDHIDLRLFNNDLMIKSLEIVKSILSQNAKGWYIKYKDQLIADLKGQNMSYLEIKEYVNKCIQEKYIDKVFLELSKNKELQKLQPGLGNLLVEQARYSLNVMKALQTIKVRIDHHQEEHQALLMHSHPIKSRIQPWLKQKLREFLNEFLKDHQWDAHKQVIDDCRQDGLNQMVYFLQRDLTFKRDREKVLSKELMSIKEPMRLFKFKCQIWSPKYWVVKKRVNGKMEVIPTIISTPFNTATPSNLDIYSIRPEYSVNKYKIFSNTSRLPFWRVANYFLRTMAWAWNAIFLFGIVIPWCSPVGLRALFSSRPFMPDYILNHHNGTICPNLSNLTHTMVSRLNKLWHHVRKSRRKFEAEPETTFLGKSFTRHINRFWNFVIKGALGSSLIVVVMVPVCLIVSILSIILAVTTVLWIPIVTLMYHLFMIFIFDFDHPDKDKCRWFYIIVAVVYRIIICGIVQPIAALITALILLPIASIILAIGALLRRSLCEMWDAFMFHIVIKTRAIIPTKDSFIVRRIKGPGLASHYFYQVRPEQALAAAEAKMEIYELNVWKDKYIRLIEMPKDDYRRFVEKCFGPFSVSVCNEGIYHQLLTESNQYTKDLDKLIEDRQMKLSTGLDLHNRNRIRLTSRELKVVIAQLSKMLEAFFPTRVFQNMNEDENNFWDKRHLEARDWNGLSTQILTEVFSPSFLSPLEETDTCFRLEVHHLNLTKYLEMLQSTEFRDDLDIVSTIHTPKGDVDVNPPFLDIRIFQPDVEIIGHNCAFQKCFKKSKRYPWKRKYCDIVNEKLSQTLPIAHPAVISLLIFNRDMYGSLIDLSNNECKCILKKMQLRGCTIGEVQQSLPLDRVNVEPDIIQVHLAEQEISTLEPYSPTQCHSFHHSSVASNQTDNLPYQQINIEQTQLGNHLSQIEIAVEDDQTKEVYTPDFAKRHFMLKEPLVSQTKPNAEFRTKEKIIQEDSNLKTQRENNITSDKSVFNKIDNNLVVKKKSEVGSSIEVAPFIDVEKKGSKSSNIVLENQVGEICSLKIADGIAMVDDDDYDDDENEESDKNASIDPRYSQYNKPETL